MAAARDRYFDWGRRSLIAPVIIAITVAVWAVVPVGRIEPLGWVAAVVAAALGAAWASLRRPTRRRAAGAAALMAILTLLLNSASAIFVVELIDSRWPLADANWLQVMLILTANVGAVFAGFRSAATRSETAATLHALAELQVAATSVPIVEASVRAYQSSDLAVVVEELETMLRLAINLRLLPPEFTRGRVWVRDDRHTEWFMCGASGFDALQDFKLPVVQQPRDGAGIVPNLAAFAGPGIELDRAWIDGDVFVTGAEVGRHRWFRSRTPESVPPVGMLAVMLRDGGLPIGALTLTSETPISIGPRDREEIEFVLRTWSWAFAVGIKKLRWFLTNGSPDRKLDSEASS